MEYDRNTALQSELGGHRQDFFCCCAVKAFILPARHWHRLVWALLNGRGWLFLCHRKKYLFCNRKIRCGSQRNYFTKLFFNVRNTGIRRVRWGWKRERKGWRRGRKQWSATNHILDGFRIFVSKVCVAWL